MKWLTINPAYNTVWMQKAVQEVLVITTTSMSNSAVSSAQDQLNNTKSSSDDFCDYEVTGCSTIDRSHDENKVLRHIGDSRSLPESLDNFPTVNQLFSKLDDGTV